MTTSASNHLFNNNVNTNPYAVINQQLNESAELRRIQAELNQIGDEIRRFSRTDDAFKQILSQWHRRFNELLRTPRMDLASVINAFVNDLQHILVDPASFRPLTERVFVGSDGNAYNYETRRVYRSSPHAAEPIPRPAYDVENPVPHELAIFMVRWLKIRRGEPLTEQVQTNINERIARLRAQRMAANQHVNEQTQQFNAGLQQADQTIRAAVGQLNVITEQWQEHAAEYNVHLDQLETTEEQNNARLQAEIAATTQQIDALAEERRQLETRLEHLDSQIHRAEKEAMQLQIAINETRQMLAEQKSSWLAQLGTVIAVIGACYFATWALQGISGLNGAISINGLSRGGAMAHVVAAL